MQNGGPLISVVIPVYNRKQTLRYCLESVLGQTYSALEVLVIDDCSSDGTVDVATSIDDRRIRVLRLPRKSGAQAARNAGIRAAQGEWIAFLDSDDEWLSDKLSRQIEVLKEVGNDLLTVVHTDCWRLDSRTDTRAVYHVPPIEGDAAFSRLLASASPMFQAMLVSKYALEQIGFLDEEIPAHQEWDTAIRLAKICRFIHIKEPLFIYHCHSGETISGSIIRHAAGHRYVIEKFRSDIIRHHGAEAFDGHLRLCALNAMRGGAFAEAETVLGMALGRSGKTSFLRWNCRLGRTGGGKLACWFANILYRRLSG